MGQFSTVDVSFTIEYKNKSLGFQKRQATSFLQKKTSCFCFKDEAWRMHKQLVTMADHVYLSVYHYVLAPLEYEQRQGKAVQACT